MTFIRLSRLVKKDLAGAEQVSKQDLELSRTD